MRRKRAFTLVELLVVLAIISILAALIMPAVQSVRELARKTQCRNNLRQLGVALNVYVDTHGVFPSGYIFSPPPANPPAPGPVNSVRVFDAPPPVRRIVPNGPGWGWAAMMLPFVEHGVLSDQISFGIPVEDAVNRDQREQRLGHLTCPSDRTTGLFTVWDELNQPIADVHTNSYAACFGSFGLMNTNPDLGNGLFQRNSGHTPSNVIDGMSHTMAFGERAALFARTPWAGVMTAGTVRTTPGAPVYTSITELAPAMTMARIGKRTLNSPYSEPYDFFSAHADIVFFTFADGSVHSLTSSTNHDVLHALATRGQRRRRGQFLDEAVLRNEYAVRNAAAAKKATFLTDTTVQTLATTAS